jgi:hypothetical protein
MTLPGDFPGVFGVTVRLMSYTLQFIRGTGSVSEAITRMAAGRNPDRVRTAVLIRDGLCPHVIGPERRHSLGRYGDDRRRPLYSGIGNREQQHYDAERIFGLEIGVGDPEPSPAVLRGNIGILRRRICDQHT